MKFLNDQNEEVKLNKSNNIPGYEIIVNKDVVLESPVNNPFFKSLKGVNILQLPKKMKGFKDNPDIERLLDPSVIDTEVKVEVEKNQIIIFQPNLDVLQASKVYGEMQLFSSMANIRPILFNYGLHNVKLKRGTVIGNIIILNSVF
ncbi:hypothetical protein KGP39_03115 [Weissella hellenica]|nr:hypothetical protein [Weissella hellenica]